MIGGKRSNGYLHGTVSPTDGTITGDRISYVYPDMETELLGRFEDGIMRDAQESNIEAINVDENGYVYITFSNELTELKKQWEILKAQGTGRRRML